MKKAITVKNQLKQISQSGSAETKAFAQEVLDVIEYMETEGAKAYYEGKADGMETVLDMLFKDE